MKADTPAIPGVKSRMKALAQERQEWDGAGMVNDKDSTKN